MPAFEKKPSIIEAVRVFEKTIIPAAQTHHDHDLTAEPGDWIVKGIKGELYPVKDDIFRELHRPVGMEGAKEMLKTFENPTVENIDEPVILAHPMRDKFNDEAIDVDFEVAYPDAVDAVMKELGSTNLLVNGSYMLHPDVLE